MTIRSTLLLTLIALATAPTALAAGNAADGEKKSQTCQACHGKTGNETVDGQYPKLAGQYADYLERALRDYKTGARQNAIMAGLLQTLTDQDIADLAAFYAAQKGDLEDLSHLE